MFMKKYEYNIVEFKTTKYIHDAGFINKIANEKGAEGWEMVDVVTYTGSSVDGFGRDKYSNDTSISRLHLYFKREKEML